MKRILLLAALLALPMALAAQKKPLDHDAYDGWQAVSGTALSPDITQHYPMWIARYNQKQPRFKPWTMWQFTDKAVLYGASGYVDLSVIQ